jgi:hypothetical protein
VKIKEVSMHLLVATILPVRDRGKWFRIQFQDSQQQNKGTWKTLPGGGEVHFTPKFGVWRYFPKFGGLMFLVKEVAGDPPPTDQVMLFMGVRWDFLDAFSCNTFKGPGFFGAASSEFSQEPRKLVWVAGPGLGLGRCKPVPGHMAAPGGVTSDPAKGIVSHAKPCYAVICPDPDAHPLPGR